MWRIAEPEEFIPPPERVQLLHLDDDDWLACIDFDCIAPALECNDPRWARTCKNAGTEREPWAIGSDLAVCARRAHTFRRMPVYEPEPSPDPRPLEQAVEWMAKHRASPPEVDEEKQQLMKAEAQAIMRAQFEGARRAMLAAGMTAAQINSLALDMGLDMEE